MMTIDTRKVMGIWWAWAWRSFLPVAIFYATFTFALVILAQNIGAAKVLPFLSISHCCIFPLLCAPPCIWALKSALSKEYGGCRIIVVGEEGAGKVSYRQTVAIWCAWAWRWIAVVTAIFVAEEAIGPSRFYAVFRNGEFSAISVDFFNTGLMPGTFIALVASIWLLGVVVRKKYDRYSLILVQRKR